MVRKAAQRRPPEAPLVCADLYGDEDDEGEDSRQRRVSQDEAGVDDANDEDDRDAHHKRGEDDGLEQLVAIAGQNVNHLEEGMEKLTQRWRTKLQAMFGPATC